MCPDTLRLLASGSSAQDVSMVAGDVQNILDLYRHW